MSESIATPWSMQLSRCNNQQIFRLDTATHDVDPSLKGKRRRRDNSVSQAGGMTQRVHMSNESSSYRNLSRRPDRAK